MQALKPLEIPLEGKHLIQASAGTGKTWTISLLYLRLIIEQELTVSQLLVVTYTRAATEELRERIRARLKKAVDLYASPEQVRKFAAEYRQLLKHYPTSEERLWCLRRALLSFDEAAVFTIHGFCQRALQENAFEVGLPFDSELIQDEAELQLALTDQFWQQRLLQPNALDQAVLEQETITPDSLLADVSNFIGKPYLQPVCSATITEADYQSHQQQFHRLLNRAGDCWQHHKADILARLSPQVMNQQVYKPARLEAASTQLQQLFSGQPCSDIEKTLLKFTPEYIAQKTKKNQPVPEHEFFTLAEQLQTCLTRQQAMHENALEQLRFDLLKWLREQLPLRKQQAGVLAFDDLLINLQEALSNRPALAAALASQYPVALIDEFQDTDPVQFRVFEQIYAQAGELFYVGDPKQAIYSFRGADIHTYLYAAEGVTEEKCYTLDKNFRSQPELISAFNHLFSYSDDPFRNQGRIGYEAVQAGGVVKGRFSSPDQSAPLRLWDWDNHTDNDAKTGVQAVSEQIARAIANDIALRLQQAQAGQACINNQPVQSGDFAILVRSHRQGRLIKQALQRCGIASVQKSPVGIFETREAQELRNLLTAIADPGHPGKIRRALVTELMGGNAQLLIDLDTHPEQLDNWLEHFYRWHQLWLDKGFMAMLRDWMYRNGVYERLLAYVDGERRLTNLLHLGELIHAETREHWRGMQATLRWLQQRAEQSSSQDEHQLRLESDENLVQIVTIHKSKGLQYPLVYCPFLWNESDSTPGKRWFTWYDPDTGQSCLQAGPTERERALENRRAEEMSENLRLLYVALTRAQYQCTVVLTSGEIPGFNYRSALTWLLFGHLPEAEKIMATKQKLDPEKRQRLMHQQLQTLTASSNSTIAWESLPAQDNVIHHQPEQARLLLSARIFKQSIPAPLRVGSFSSLTSGQHHERPEDKDGRIELSAPKAWQHDRSHFPGGARAGVCLHKMLERLDFRQPLDSQRHDVIERSLQEQGFEAHWQPAAESLLHNTLHTPLLPDQSLTLQKIAREARLDEMEFYFPVRQLDVKHLQQILHIGLPEGKKWAPIRAALQQLSFRELHGFMKGFIDLIFRWEAQYYVVDYKSNWLGEHPDDYTPDRLQQAMAEAHYYLQYLIYCVALHRYLRQRLGPEYHWNTHVGGVLYLFLRGMQPGTSHQNGVFFDKPEYELIAALDQLMGYT